jgi:two-component system response regulator RegX3
MRILVVEDEEALREGLCDLLRGDGHEVESIGNGTSAVELGLKSAFDLIVLDVMLPGLGGIEVCRQLRSARPGLSILMLTALGSEDDTVRGLVEGADDYMTKPFAARELLARVRAMGRRHLGGAIEESPTIDGVSFDLGKLVATTRDGTSISITAREAGILRLLLRHPDRAVSRAELLEQVWSARADLETRAVDMAIATLRKKIEPNPSKPTIICTVKGAGYILGSPPT